MKNKFFIGTSCPIRPSGIPQIMKKQFMVVLLSAIFATGIAGTGSAASVEEITSKDAQAAQDSGLTLHKIGVPTYNVNDSQIKMFKDYLDNYVKQCFPDVTFVYPDSLQGADDLMSFLQQCADADVEGILALLSYDVKTEMDFCAENEMYYIRASGTTTQQAFDSVADNPYYVGEIGPGSDLEYQAGVDMVLDMADPESSDTYIVLSCGATMGNEMHRLRTVGILKTLEEQYGVTFETDAEKLACVDEDTHIEAGKLSVDICPGYLEIPAITDEALKVINSGSGNVLFSVGPVATVSDALKERKIRYGVIDCYSEENRLAFQNSNIDFVAGKYQSEIGPAFAALYNAITGNADAFRKDGKAFRLTQGFWNSCGAREYEEKYGLASGAAVTAYNYDDLYSVVLDINPDATFEDFKELTESYTYEECWERRQ